MSRFAMLSVLFAAACARSDPEPEMLRTPPVFVDDEAPYRLDPGLVSRSASFENPTGAKGAGGTAASPLGVGRKGRPARMLAAGEKVVLLDVDGPGTIRHIWMTTLSEPWVLRSAVVRAYWDDQAHPSIEAPLGDLFGFAHGAVVPYQSAVHSVGVKAALNLWLPMPFTRGARIELANEGASAMPLFYQVDFTQGDLHAEDVGRLHVLFRRENPTALGRDFELLPKRSGMGRYLGAVIGVRALSEGWWGEGEMKVHLDGDDSFATIVGTGSEDYVCLSWGIQPTPFWYHGASLKAEGFVSMYRWHLPDPIYWSTDARVSIQQIGHKGETLDPDRYLEQLVERADDWSSATFWYEPVPSAPLPPIPDVAARTASIWGGS